jgi:CheY-like chemotaxis protein
VNQIPRRILVADNSPTVRQALCDLFESSGFRICAEATNGAEAWEQAVESNPDLIILDLSMPVMSGLQAAYGIRRTLPNTPIILFTMYADSVITKDAMAAGVSSVIAKSDVSTLISEARAHLNS